MIRIIQEETPFFILETDDTSYMFKVTGTGHLEHLYYGARIKADSSDGLVEQHEFAEGNTNSVDDAHRNFSLENIRLEMSSYGKGDIREPLIEVVNTDGSSTVDLRYQSYEVSKGKEEPSDFPGSYGSEDEVDCLRITLEDEENDLRLDMFYYVYAACNVITRRCSLTNRGKDPVTVDRLMSMLIDFDDGDYKMHTFTGAWAREMHRTETPIKAGKTVVSSYTGTSSSRANPFVMITDGLANEEYGKVYGFNLIYSGNHYECCEMSPYGKMRFVAGINPAGFRWVLEQGKSFDSPEEVMTFSREGFGKMSHNMHDFVNTHVVRGEWKERLRPILLNSWEACYFNITESGLLKLARQAVKIGIELFVMDDGWFGARNDDTSSLGDWYANKKKLPGGVEGLCRKIRALGMDFGIWVEPEMVNENSELYRAHPDWVIRIPSKKHSVGRNQMILDLTRQEVQDFIIDMMTGLLSSCEISYIKWDMNRTFTDIFSAALPADRQGEVIHRYYMGLYHVMNVITKKFPKVLFEGCAAGGNRFDLGILSYFPQIWASDDTDPLVRAEIQTSYSYGYPLSTIACHVSDSPNHQTLRRTHSTTRFNVAAFGVLGYESNLCDMRKEQLEGYAKQIACYKEWRQTMQFGRFYRILKIDESLGRNSSVITPTGGRHLEWCAVSEDKSLALSMILQLMVVPNSQSAVARPRGLDPDALYEWENRKLSYSILDFGSLVNTSAPIHIRADGHNHHILDRFVRMPGEDERHKMYGDAIMNAGVHLKSAFAAVGYDDQVRFYQDYATRIYVIKRVNDGQQL
ncbi:alpha-galactosidase [Ruminococcaceae bacterium YRB3002]|nr:alpha-galactosidase [Ruminococcaceae bacterium YRB3002]